LPGVLVEFEVPDGTPEPDGMAPVEPEDGPPDPDVTDPPAGAEPEEPEVALPPVLGSIAGDPDVVEPEPDAVGRSDEGRDRDPCASAGAASTVARTQPAIAFVSMIDRPALE
jgi:hypothetical protein